MNYKTFLPMLLCFLFCASSDNRISGTATDTSSGTISGKVLNDGQKYQDTVEVTLYHDATSLSKRKGCTSGNTQSFTTGNGEYLFKNLPEGDYSIRIIKEGLVIGEETGIELPKDAHVIVNITIIIIINQIFNITYIDSSKHITINNFYIANAEGKVEQAPDGSFKATFTGKDTVFVTGSAQSGNQSDSVNITFIKQPDGTYRNSQVHTTIPLTVTDGPTSMGTGFGGDSTTVIIKSRILEEPR